MRIVLLLALLATGVVLGGCGREGTARAQPDSDGEKCDDKARAVVFIEVKYRDGTPYVIPEQCVVKPNGKITWRGPESDEQEFKIVFRSSEETPIADTRVLSATNGQMRSVMDAKRQKFKMSAWGKDGTYTYDIKTATGATDPTIIIRPQ